jgi:hypothetical protein
MISRCSYQKHTKSPGRISRFFTTGPWLRDGDLNWKSTVEKMTAIIARKTVELLHTK